MSGNRKAILSGALSGALALMSVMAMGGAAGARHNNANAPHNIVGAIRISPSRGGPLGVMMAELVRDCERLTVELKNFPADQIAQSVILDDTQAGTLRNAQNAANEAAKGVAETCPSAVPAEPADRLDMIEREIDGIDDAVKVLQPALIALYGSLNDEQKGHVVLIFAGLEGRRKGPPETTGSAPPTTIEGGTRRRSKKSSDDRGDVIPPPGSQTRWNCEKWQAELRAWPVDRVERNIAVGPRQRAVFYELAAAVQHAADTLADSCPQNNSVTPVAKVDDLKKKIDAVRNSAAIIRPALTGFRDVLDEDQRSRFNDAI